MSDMVYPCVSLAYRFVHFATFLRQLFCICLDSTPQVHIGTGLPLGGRTAYITSKNRLRAPKLHIKDVPRTSENSLVRPKMDIETSCLQKKPAHIYQIT